MTVSILSFVLIGITICCAKTITISNTEPRLDTNGNIINAHDGVVQQFEPNGDFFFYGMGYGNCLEPPGSNGCADGSVNDSCGFEYNHTINLYTSPNLTSGSWKYQGNILPIANRPGGILFSPIVVFNKNTNKYILWAIWLANPNFSTSKYLVAESTSPFGPFITVIENVNVTQSIPGSGQIFVDNDAKNTAYLIYTSLADNHRILIEQLNSDYMSSAGSTTKLFNSSGCVEIPTMFKNVTTNIYYAFNSYCCCYCEQGSDVIVWKSENGALGEYKQIAYINDKQGNGNNKNIVINAQQSFVFPINTTNGIQWIWYGDRWQSATDRIKAHDFTYFGPLEMNGDGFDIMQWRDNFTISLF
eukprot:158294_1